MLISIFCTLNFKIYQIDVKSVFLNGYLRREVNVTEPKKLQNPHYPDHVLELKKNSMYELKQTLRV